jgi:exopolysaccharide production protein ExoZ
MVVMHHARNPYPWLFNPVGDFSGFARGVDVFFVISGFIMAAVGVKDRPVEFLKKRVLRVVPIYWAATLVAAVTLVRKDGLDAGLIHRVWQSLLFIPHLDPKGEAFPIVPPGWTLNFEMLFYALFALALCFARPLRTAGLWLAALVAAGLVLQPTHVVANTFTSPLLLEFMVGMLIGHCRHQVAAVAALGWLALPGWALLLMSTHWVQSLVAACFIVVSALALERRLPHWAFGKALGDASYFLYLSHHFVLIVLAKVWKGLPLQGPLQFGTMFAASVGVSVLVGLWGHQYLEKPLHSVLWRLLLPARSRVTAVG